MERLSVIPNAAFTRECSSSNLVFGPPLVVPSYPRLTLEAGQQDEQVLCNLVHVKGDLLQRAHGFQQLHLGRGAEDERQGNSNVAGSVNGHFPHTPALCRMSRTSCGAARV